MIRYSELQHQTHSRTAPCLLLDYVIWARSKVGRISIRGRRPRTFLSHHNRVETHIILTVQADGSEYVLLLTYTYTRSHWNHQCVTPALCQPRYNNWCGSHRTSRQMRLQLCWFLLSVISYWLVTCHETQQLRRVSRRSICYEFTCV